jgi:hypothetical protein
VVVDPTATGDLADFVRQVRNQRPDVKLVGHAERGSIAALSGVGLDDIIAKPWNVSAFVDLLVDSR